MPKFFLGMRYAFGVPLANPSLGLNLNILLIMNHSKSYKAIRSLFGLAALSIPAFGITITLDNSAASLGNTMLGAGVTLNSATFISQASGSTGTFTNGGALGINSGIVLTTGSAAIAGQPQNSPGATQDNGLGGYAPLNALIPGFSTLDATVLRLDFTTTSDGSIFFNYTFGSEEYNEYVGSQFNDVFGFFLDGTSLANNLALIPSTSTPVSINNVNGVSNSSYYRNNDASQLSSGLQYDGFTTVLTASATNLLAGNHTLYIAIADAGDRVLDSGVFIQANSFSTTQTPTSVPDSAASIVLIGFALGLLGVFRRKSV